MGVKQTSKMGLPDLSRQLTTVKSPDFRLKMARNLAEEARTKISDGFQAQRDPYGKAWAPLQNPGKKRRGGMILQASGRMAASVSTRPSVSGFRIDIPVTYAAPHQYGAQPHARAGRANPVGRSGRFISRRRAGSTKARSQRVAMHGAFIHSGIPQRQMVPMNSTGGLGPIWTPAFYSVANKLLTEHFRGAAP